jgi:restriction endonuclease S subunit
MKRLITYKDYCKREKLSEAGARKRSLSTIKFEDQIYIVEESHEVENLKAKVKNLTLRVKEQKARAEKFERQDELIQELKEEKQELKERVKFLETRLDNQVEQKEKLYEKVIGHMIEHKS